jgi:hypothetical protein
MSIYRRRGWDDVSDIHAHLAPGKASAPEKAPSSAPPAEPQDWSKFRKAKPAEHLLPLTQKFLDQLPPQVFPSALAMQYARILNLIVLQWDDRSSCVSYFKELLTDQRGGRQGFPAPVKRDLVELWAYWTRTGPPREA